MQRGKSDSTTRRSELATIVGDVLGDLAFLVGGDRPPVPASGAAWMECRIAYSGPVGGTLHCWCTRDFALQLAANLLGLSPDNPAVLSGIDDALGEFMNVVCGQFVTACHGTDRVFNLSIPTPGPGLPPPQISFDGRETACALSVSGEPFYCKCEPERE